jgi:hypothetical protein
MCITFNNVIAQVPIYFPNGSKWRMENTDFQNNPFVTKFDYVYNLTGDSIIGQNVYKKIELFAFAHEEWIGSTVPNPNVTFNSWTTNSVLGTNGGLIRQVGKKVYCRRDLNGQSTDTLLYDFDLEIGDTLPITLIQSDSNIIVTGKDSILINSNYIKVFTLNSLTCSKLIEGIGSENGLFESMNQNLNESPELLCYVINQTSFYPTLGAICEFNVGISKTVVENNFEVYPNPVFDILTIKYPSINKDQKIAVYDISGREHSFKCEFVMEGFSKIDVSNLDSGIYFLRLINNDNTWKEIKICKE